ncbi:uncharacterized protein RSE6_06442 [Rhynchosporium secalis]|uniref:Uncharacterized protein n=1 Tax=Rhynchosporium secalis TaxID=38038 RepID=A0A1E1MAF9_RHYSE|nr:uncharacterized protein RSE6_06442 [Rhynchosporium secalis]
MVKNIISYNEDARLALIKDMNQAVPLQGLRLQIEIFEQRCCKSPSIPPGSPFTLDDLSATPGLKRFMLRDHLIALGILKHDLTAGLAVPDEILAQERSKEDGSRTGVVRGLSSYSVISKSRDREL